MPLHGWREAAADVMRRTVKSERIATPEQCARLASVLEIPEVRNLAVNYRLTASARDRYRLEGELAAVVVQSCVVSLEPVEARLRLPIDAEFRTDPEIAVTAGADETEVLALPDYEPTENGELAIGRVVYETLAAGLDPYPRKAGAEFTWQDEAGRAATSPFAALARLKREP